MLRVIPALQSYAWGSRSALQDFFGVTDPGPLAEAWFGAHPAAPAQAGAVALDAHIAADPQEVLGADVVARFGPRLPYLLKVIAADRPLSLQVHPGIEAAREGFAREEAAGIARDAPERNYRDANHKPELVYAITPFEALCGFRAPRRVTELLDGLEDPLAAELLELLRALPAGEGVRAAFSHVLDAATRPTPEQVAGFVDAVRQRLAGGSPSPRADSTVLLLAEAYPGDPGVVAALLLNPVSLRPGEALFVPAGSVHAYLSGMGIEVMASSDNVLRAGLTAKHVDVPELLRLVDHVAAPPIRVAPEIQRGGIRVFYVPVDDFELSIATVGADATGTQKAVRLRGRGPRIVLCLDGRVDLTCDGERLELSRGQAVLVSAGDGQVEASGDGTVVQVDVP